jgi:hypothetical protein
LSGNNPAVSRNLVEIKKKKQSTTRMASKINLLMKIFSQRDKEKTKNHVSSHSCHSVGARARVESKNIEEAKHRQKEKDREEKLSTENQSHQ